MLGQNLLSLVGIGSTDLSTIGGVSALAPPVLPPPPERMTEQEKKNEIRVCNNI